MSDPQSIPQDLLSVALNGLTLAARKLGYIESFGFKLPASKAVEQWEGISRSSHNWVSAGVPQVVDWSLPSTGG